jgi:sucrose-6-phosphate hydrolase SacC (GH32 family)
LEQWHFNGYAYGSGKGATWEMPDLFVLGGKTNGMTVFKTGMENGTDYWATGRYDEHSGKFIVGNGSDEIQGGSKTQAYDYGLFYASKSFLASDGRRVLIGCTNEDGGPLKDWGSIQSVPRVIAEDPEHPGRILFWPVVELEALRIHPPSKMANLRIAPQSAIVANAVGPQLDVTITVDGWARGTHFGLSCLGGLANATVETRPAAKTGTLRLGPHSGDFPLPQRTSAGLTLRVLVDRSVVEAFASEGRAVITHRVYKNKLGGEEAVKVLNAGNSPLALRALQAFKMRSSKGEQPANSYVEFVV